MKLWKQMSVIAHCSCFVPLVSMITSEMTRLTITENISKISIRLFWKASSAFAESFYNTQCQLKLLSAFEFWASLVADVIFAQDQIIYYLKKKLLKMKIDGMFRNGIVKILIWTNTYARTGKYDLEFIKETLPKEIILIKSWICVKMCCRCQSRKDVCCVHQTTN